MAEKDSQGPSLELPSLFRRKRAQEPQDTAESAAPTEAPTTPPEEVRPAPTAEVSDTAPLPEVPASETAPGAEAPAAGKPRRPRPQLSLPSIGASRGDRRPPDSPTPAGDPGSRAQPLPRHHPGREPEPQPEREPRRAPEPVAGRQETDTPEPLAPAAVAAAPAAAPAATAGATRRSAPAGGTATRDRPADPAEEPREERPRRRPTLPAVAAATAALVVGAAVGLLGVVLTFLGLRGCELIAGTSSCGGPGLLVLVAIFVAMVLAGGAALKLFGVPEAGSVSFLGTGLLMVIVLFFFLEALDHVSMVIVIPAIAALCFALARWVTTQLSEDVMEER